MVDALMPKLLKLQEKVVLIGDPAVGKTSMINKFVYNEFTDKYVSTLGTKVSKMSITYDKLIKGRVIELNLMIWDVMGQSGYSIFHQSAFVGAQGALIVADITRRDTIVNWEQWKYDLFKLTGKIPVIMIGNKNDLANGHSIAFNELEKLAKINKVPVYFTSAKTGENIEKVFKKLGEVILKTLFKSKTKKSKKAD
jgi:small GTP-binding protein